MTHESLDPKLVTPDHAIDETEEFIEATRHELPESVYGEGIPDYVIEQYNNSWDIEGKGWKIKRGAGAAAIVLIVSVAGWRHFRNDKKNEAIDDGSED